MTSMTITIERTPRTLHFEGTAIEVEELSVRLPFARKPADLSEVGGEGKLLMKYLPSQWRFSHLKRGQCWTKVVKLHLVSLTYRLFPGERLPAFDDHIHVLGIELNEPGTTARLFTGDQGSARAAKRV